MCVNTEHIGLTSTYTQERLASEGIVVVLHTKCDLEAPHSVNVLMRAQQMRPLHFTILV